VIGPGLSRIGSFQPMKRTIWPLLQAQNPFKEVATIRDKPIHPGESVVAIGRPFHGLLTSEREREENR
jgi:hypothetical protein